MNNTFTSKLKSRALSLVVIMALLSFGVSGAFATDDPPAPTDVTLAGAGNITDPYVIYSCEDLQAVRVHPDATYFLNANVDCSNSSSLNNDAGFEPISDFTGTFDGRNFTISGLTISRGSDALGLFASTSESALIQNLRLNDVHITNTSDESNAQTSTGLLVGNNAGDIYNIFADGSSVNAGNAVGGIVGTNFGSMNKVQGEVIVTATGSNDLLLGGIVGQNSGTISNTAARGYILSLDSYSYCGGIAGLMADGSISYSYSTGTIECSNHRDFSVGGLVGLVQGTSGITDSFSTSAPNHVATFDGGVVGNNDANISLETTHFDASKATLNVCDSSGNTSCEIVNTDDTDGDHFKNTVQAQPLDVWDFTNAWVMHEDNYPSVNIDIPPTPRASTDLAATVDGNNIALTWNGPTWVETGGDITGYNTEYSTDNGDNWSTVQSPSPGSTIENTDPNLEYRIRVRAENSGGLGAPTYFITVHAIPHSVVDLTTSSVLSRSARLTWDDSSTFPSIDHFDVQYKKSSDSDWTDFELPDPLASSVVVAPLDEQSQYDFRVLAVNERGSGGYSPTATATTTAQHDYTISTCTDLQNINEDLAGHYTLAGDIDCTDTPNWNNGLGFSPIGSAASNGLFLGSLDGAGHSINGLTINRIGSLTGLFAYINNATIENLTFHGGSLHQSAPAEGTAYTDYSITPSLGAVAAISSGSTIDNVTSDLSIPGGSAFGINGGAGGLIGMVMPGYSSVNGQSPSTTLTNVHTSGNISAISSGGLVGAVMPFNMSVFTGSVGISDFFNSMPSTVALAVDGASTSGNVICLAACGGIVGLNLGGMAINDTTTSGVIGTNSSGELNLEGSSNLTDLLVSILMSSPIAGGFVGVSLPLSTGAVPATVAVTDSQSNATVRSLFGGGIIGINLPSPTLNLANFNLSNTVNSIFANTSFSTENVTMSGNVECSMICGGIAGLAFGGTQLTHTTTTGSITNDNTRLFDNNSPLAACPIQSTGGFVGMQIFTPLTVEDSTSSATVNNVQKGGSDSKTMMDLVSTFQLSDICNIVRMVQGTGGIVGTYLNPASLVSILSQVFSNQAYPVNISDSSGLTISDTSTSGAVSTDAPSASGGLAGYIFGEAHIDGTHATGTITSTSAYDLANPLINSASTGGLLGSVLGDIDVNPNTAVQSHPVEVTNSYATGNILSDNKAGGLIGTIQGLTSVSRSFATGDVYGTEAGGLIGSGADMSTPLAMAGLAGSTDIADTYATGDVIARDDPDRSNVAGGLIGIMGYVGNFHLSNSYSSGNVSIENNSTQTHSLLGGLAGGIADMSPVIHSLMGNYQDTVESYIGQVGLSFHDDISISNSFTTSHVIASHNQNSAFANFINTKDTDPETVSGALFGVVYAGHISDGSNRNPSSYLSGLTYDSSKTDASRCANTIDVSDFFSNSGPHMTALSGSPCNKVNEDGTDGSHFINTSSVAPLNSWDFANLWKTHVSGLPTFSADPIIPPECTADTCPPPPPPPPPCLGCKRPWPPKPPITKTQFQTVAGGLNTAVKMVPTPAKVLGAVEEKVAKKTLIPGRSAKGQDNFLLRNTIPAILIVILALGFLFFGNKKKILLNLRNRYR